MLRASWNLPPRRRESLYQDPFTTTVSLSCIEGFQVIKHIHWWPEPCSQTLNTGCNCIWRLIFAISAQHLTKYRVYFFAGLHWKVAVTSLIPLYHRSSSWAGALSPTSSLCLNSQRTNYQTRIFRATPTLCFVYFYLCLLLYTACKPAVT